MTTCVSGGVCMSRSNLRLGTSEGESDALFGKGSGSHRVRERCLWPRMRRGGEFAEQAVALETFDFHWQDLSDDIGGGHHMGRLEIRGAADDLDGIAAGA